MPEDFSQFQIASPATTEDFSAFRAVTPAPQTQSFDQFKPVKQQPAPQPSGLGDFFDMVNQFSKAKYVWGGNSPTGTDCSGMVCQIAKKFGVDLPRTAREQFEAGSGKHIKPDPASMKPGDAIFFRDTGGRKGITHVAVYLGDGKYGAMSGRKTGYREGMVGDKLWGKVAGVRRFLPEAAIDPAITGLGSPSLKELPGVTPRTLRMEKLQKDAAEQGLAILPTGNKKKGQPSMVAEPIEESYISTAVRGGAAPPGAMGIGPMEKVIKVGGKVVQNLGPVFPSTEPGLGQRLLETPEGRALLEMAQDKNHPLSAFASTLITDAASLLSPTAAASMGLVAGAGVAKPVAGLFGGQQLYEAGKKASEGNYGAAAAKGLVGALMAKHGAADPALNALSERIVGNLNVGNLSEGLGARTVRVKGTVGKAKKPLPSESFGKEPTPEQLAEVDRMLEQANAAAIPMYDIVDPQTGSVIATGGQSLAAVASANGKIVRPANGKVGRGATASGVEPAASAQPSQPRTAVQPPTGLIEDVAPPPPATPPQERITPPPAAPIVRRVPGEVGKPDRLLSVGKGGNWREVVDAEADPFVRHDMLRKVANSGRNVTDADLSAVLDRIDEASVGSNAWNAAYDVASNPSASKATRARALAMRDEWMKPGRMEAEAAPSSPATPGDVSSNAKPGATGLANQVQAREAEAKILSDVEATKGHSPEYWQQRGEELLSSKADPVAEAETLARQVGNHEAPLTGDRVAVLLAGKRRLMQMLNEARDRLDADPTNKDLQAAYEAAKQRIDDYQTNVQQGKGDWSEVGRALQAGTDIDTGDFAQVLAESRRRGSRTSEAKLKALSDEVRFANEQVEAYRRRVEELESQGVDKGVAQETAAQEGAIMRRTRTRQNRAKTKEGLKQEFASLWEEFKSAGKGKTEKGEDLEAMMAGFSDEHARILLKMARNLVQQGVVRAEEIVSVLHDTVKEIFPETTRREVMDAISGYGRTAKPRTPEEIALAKAKALMYRMAKLEDAMKGQNPKKRPAPNIDAEARALDRDINSFLKSNRMEVRKPPKRGVSLGRSMGSRQQAAKSRLAREIAELDRRIRDKDFGPKFREPIEADAELARLQSERAAKKAEYDAIKPPKVRVKRVMSNDTKLKMAKGSVRKQIEDITRRLQENDYSKRTKGTGTLADDELASLQSQLKGLKSLYSTAKVPTDIAAQLAKSKVVVAKRISELKQQVLSGKIEPPNKKKPLTDAELDNLRSEQQYWNQRVKNALSETDSMPMRIARGVGDFIRSTILGGDIGTMARQGAVIVGRAITGDPTALRAIKGAGKVIFSEANMRKQELRWLEERYDDGRLKVAVQQKAGLKAGDRLTEPEELALSRVLARGLGPLGGSLHRAQHYIITEMRKGVFDQGVKRGMTNAELKEWAASINTLTGKTNIPIPKAANTALSLLFTSPGYELSRWAAIREMAKAPTVDLVKAARGNKASQEKVRTVMGTAITFLAVAKLAEANGYTFNWSDPDKSDWLKLRKGNDVWDITPGIAPRLRDIASIINSWKKPEFNKNIAGTGGKVLVRAFSPTVKTPIEQGSYAQQRRDGVAEEDLKSPFSGFTPDEFNKGGILPWLPLAWSSAYQAGEENDSPSWAFLREFVGTGVSRYPQREVKSAAGPMQKRVRVTKPSYSATKQMKRLLSGASR